MDPIAWFINQLAEDPLPAHSHPSRIAVRGGPIRVSTHGSNGGDNALVPSRQLGRLGFLSSFAPGSIPPWLC